jgi:quercetin dioxygenase-like cupin family protein
VTLKPGDVLFIPAGTIHAATAVSNSKGAELATYIVEKRETPADAGQGGTRQGDPSL